MSDQNTTDTPTPAEPVEEQHEAAGDEPLGDGGKKALAAERDARKAAEKALTETTARLNEIEASQMTELERAQAELKEAQELAATATTEALRWRVASTHGVTLEDAETFLTGTDEDTLNRQAQRLAALSVSGPTTPKPDLSQGAKGTPTDAAPAQQFSAALSGIL